MAVDDKKRFGRYWYLYRNDVHCYRQYGIQGWVYIILKDIHAITNVLLHSKKDKILKIKIIIKGFLAGLNFSPDVEKWEND